MPIIITLAEARAELERRIMPDVAPTLTALEVSALLTLNKIGSVWAAETAFTVGHFLLPTNRNGHRYRVMSGDGNGFETDLTEPTWPTSDASIVTSGNLTLREDGMEISLWDFNKAAEQGWVEKAAKSTPNIAHGQKDKTFQWQQVYDHCMAMADRYKVARVA